MDKVIEVFDVRERRLSQYGIGDCVYPALSLQCLLRPKLFVCGDVGQDFHQFDFVTESVRQPGTKAIAIEQPQEADPEFVWAGSGQVIWLSAQVREKFGVPAQFDIGVLSKVDQLLDDRHETWGEKVGRLFGVADLAKKVFSFIPRRNVGRKFDQLQFIKDGLVPEVQIKIEQSLETFQCYLTHLL